MKDIAQIIGQSMVIAFASAGAVLLIYRGIKALIKRKKEV